MQDSGSCQSDHDTGVPVTPWHKCLCILKSSNLHSPGIESSPYLIRQVPLNLVLVESHGQGEYADVDKVVEFGKLGML